MKVSDLIGAVVYDAGGEFVGHCFDVEAEKTGPLVSDDFGKALQVTGLLVGSGAVIQRLGYSHRRIRGPVGLGWLARRLDSYLVPWDCLATVKNRELKLSCSKEELKALERSLPNT